MLVASYLTAMAVIPHNSHQFRCFTITVLLLPLNPSCNVAAHIISSRYYDIVLPVAVVAAGSLYVLQSEHLHIFSYVCNVQSQYWGRLLAAGTMIIPGAPWR